MPLPTEYCHIGLHIDQTYSLLSPFEIEEGAPIVIEPPSDESKQTWVLEPNDDDNVALFHPYSGLYLSGRGGDVDITQTLSLEAEPVLFTPESTGGEDKCR
ncbi:hypothetical protein RhiJN_05899 [Ceratobasidium sp. AG-Ba]|nr:hypothetical protein RhiJN_05899 [Ceratobasidium sp. AG-Ba]QRW06828.1 hypothetical protein RhiLY_05827 [Ceratobasidium sp. AG-Ba]